MYHKAEPSRNLMRALPLLMSACLCAMVQMSLANSWPAQERQTRGQLSMLACEYKAGLHDIERGGEVRSVEVDGITYPGYKNLKELHVYLQALPRYKCLFEKGNVLFAATNRCDLSNDEPKLIYAAAGENDLFRVVYTWQSDVRIVRAGTREFARVLSMAQALGCTNIPTASKEARPALRPKVITFSDEKGAPLSGTFGVHERDGGGMLSAWFRSGTTSVPHSGTVAFEDFPQSFQLFFTSTDGFYTSQNCKIQEGSVTNVVRLKSGGTLAFSIASYPKGHSQPIVAPCFRKTTEGYSQISGMGISPSVGQEHVYNGLEPGIYKVQLKNGYKDQSLIFESEDIRVRTKEKAVLPPFVVNQLPVN